MAEENPDKLTEYINIQSDFGFKFVFGNEKNKGAIIRFLNILFAGQLTVTDVKFHDKEILPASKDGKRIVYDVYCTMAMKRNMSPYFTNNHIKEKKGELMADHHFILEMQNVYTPPFEERLTYYACRMMAGQGKSGWNYDLEPVFAVAITDFNFSHLKPRLFHDMMIMDTRDHQPLTDKLHIMLCSLEEVPSSWEKCRTELEKALFLIKNMENMSSTSLAYREGDFNEFFEAARSSHLRKEDIIPYKQSVEYLHEMQRGIEYAKEQLRRQLRDQLRQQITEEVSGKFLSQGREEGLSQGREEGLSQGREEGEIIMLRKNILRLRDKGFADKDIAEMLDQPLSVVSAT